MLEIVEIIERSTQGRTRPFLCRCEDDQLYYVKGRDAGKRSHLCEWMAGHLAKEFGLPVPHFEVAIANQALISMFPEGGDLGCAPAFASRLVPELSEITFESIRSVPLVTRQDVLVFDWWVRNDDRKLTAMGGNPNLLWAPAAGKLVTIDHNLAFDPDFDRTAFRQLHCFAADIPSIVNDWDLRRTYTTRLKDALQVWPAAWAGVPWDWLFHDEEETVPTDFPTNEYFEELNGCSRAEFWECL